MPSGHLQASCIQAGSHPPKHLEGCRSIGLRLPELPRSQAIHENILRAKDPDRPSSNLTLHSAGRKFQSRARELQEDLSLVAKPVPSLALKADTFESLGDLSRDSPDEIEVSRGIGAPTVNLDRRASNQNRHFRTGGEQALKPSRQSRRSLDSFGKIENRLEIDRRPSHNLEIVSDFSSSVSAAGPDLRSDLPTAEPTCLRLLQRSHSS